jgi:hypothetical protein
MVEWAGNPMAETQKNQLNPLRRDVLRGLQVQFALVAAYILSLIIFDTWNLIPHDAMAQRWTAAGMLLGLVAVLWFAGRTFRTVDIFYKSLLYVVILADIFFAGYNVFWERGMASKAVALFAIPLITAAILRSRTALVTTAILCVAAYTTAAVRYFNLHYGEGIRVELYGEIFFYSVGFFIMTWLLFVLIRPSQKQ